MKKLLKSLLLFTLIIGIFGTSKVNAEDFIIEIPIEVTIKNGGTAEITGEGEIVDQVLFDEDCPYIPHQESSCAVYEAGAPIRLPDGGIGHRDFYKMPLEDGELRIDIYRSFKDDEYSICEITDITHGKSQNGAYLKYGELISHDDMCQNIRFNIDKNQYTVIENNGNLTLIKHNSKIINNGTFTLRFTNPNPGDSYLYIVKQVDMNDTKLIYDKTIYEVRVKFDENNKAIVTVNELESDTKSAEIIFNNEKKVGNVLVVYETEDGKTLKDIDYVIKNGELDTPFLTSELEFEGYEFIRVEYPVDCEKDGENTVTGKVREEDIIVKYIYRKITPPAPEPKGNVLVVYKSETGEVLKEVEYVIKNGDVGTPYTTEQLEFEDYEWVRVEGDPTGEVIEGDIIVTYIYRKKPVPPIKKGTLTVIYKTEDGIILKELNSEGNVGDPYSTDKLSFDGYEFSRMDSGSAAVVGEYIDGHLVITYIYKKPKPPVIPVPEPIKQLISTGGGNGAFLALGMLVSSILSLFAINKNKKGNR